MEQVEAVVSAIPLVIGTVGGSVALLLGVLKLRETMQKPRIDIRWHWKWTDGSLSSAGFYFVNETPKPAHVGHFAFRRLKPAHEGKFGELPEGAAGEFSVGGETWQFVAPPPAIEALFPFTVPPDSVSSLHMIDLSEQSKALRDVFADASPAILFVDYNGQREEFVVPDEMRLMAQEGIRYEL